MFDQVGQLSFALQQFGSGQLAFKDAVLHMVAPIAKTFEDTAEPFGFTDVISNQKDPSHSQDSQKAQLKPSPAPSWFCFEKQNQPGRVNGNQFQVTTKLRRN